MNTKKFRIRFQMLDQSFGDFKEDWKAVEKGKKPSKLVSSEASLLMMDYSMFPKVFSTERLRVIHTIQERRPASVSELAEMLEREQANVHRDVHFLAELGILELTRVKEEGKPESVRPDFHWAGFDIEMERKKKGDEAA
jgi:predicted transcriptional regulator